MLNVVCLKHGNKYGPDYVNRLHNMVRRHLTVPHRFFCFTDDPSELDPKVEIRPLPEDRRFSGWWWKPYLFKQGHFDDGDTVLFFDLDMVVVGSIDKLVTYHPGSFLGLCDVSRIFPKQPRKLGSAVMRWPANQFSEIWENIEADPKITKQYRGDQDWIWKLVGSEIKFFPDSWIRSYKWEVRQKNELVRIGNRYNFRTVRSADVDPETAVLAFHGSPDPHEVQDPIIIENWK